MTIGEVGAFEAIEEICFMPRRVSWVALITLAGGMTGWIATAPAQPPPPDGKDKKGDKKGKDKKGDEIELFQDRLERLRWQLQFTRPSDQDRQTLLQRSGTYADRADQMWKTQPYIADRTLAGAESLFRACDHLQHLSEPQGFPAPPPPPAEAFGRRLAQVYFRTREAGYFLQEIRDNTASPLPTMARLYYQRAVQAYDRADSRSADEFLKTADEIVNGLESLAQAANLAPELRRQ
jgi:hypothetical protein